jgi:hypothetical protein
MTAMSRRRVTVGAVALVALGGATLGAAADTSTVPVVTAVVNGTRTLSVTDAAGTAIGSGGLPLGAGHSGAFLVNVTDANYSHAGYQVSATMTNLYPYAGGSYDFGSTPIASNLISVGYPGGLAGLVDVESLVTPVVELTGTLNLSGLPVGSTAVSESVDGVTQSVQTLSDAVTQDTLASLLDLLPVSLESGDTGTFDNPADLPSEPSAPHANPTSKVLMNGDAQSPTALIDALVDAINNDLGGATAQELVDAGLLDQNSVLSAAGDALGIVPSLLTAGQVTTIMTTLTGTVTGITGDVLGQTGSYSTMPALTIGALPGTTETGLYRGQLVVTLMDKP